MKKEKKIILSSCILFTLLVFFASGIFTIPTASAYAGPIYLFDNFEQSVTPILQLLLGVEEVDENLFARFLFFIIVFTITATVLNKMELFKDKKPIITIISVSVSLLGTRYLGGLDIIQGVLLPYGTMMLAISIALPFLIYFFFVHNTIKSGVGRRVAWILFGAIFLGLWWTRRAEMGDLSWIYNIGIVAVIIVVLADTEIHKYFGVIEMQNAKRAQISLEISDLEAKVAHLRTNAAPSRITLDTIDKLERRISELYKKL